MRQKSLKKLRKEIEIILGFVEQRPALQISIEMGVSYQVVSRVFKDMRELLFLQCELEGKKLEKDQSFSPIRSKAILHSNNLANIERLNHSKTLVEKRSHNHINGIEGFWSYSKHKLYNYHYVSKANFVLFLKEMGYWFNHRSENILEPVMKLYFGYASY